MMTSRIPGFHRLSREARLERLAETVGLDDAERQLLRHGEALDLATADCMIENAIGVFGLPLGIAANFLINGKDVLADGDRGALGVAAASNAARLVRAGGGFTAEADPSLMIGQIQLIDVPDAQAAVSRLRADAPRLRDRARRVAAAHGGARLRREIEAQVVADGSVAVHVVADVGDAMARTRSNAGGRTCLRGRGAHRRHRQSAHSLEPLDRRLARRRRRFRSSCSPPTVSGETVSRRIESAELRAPSAPRRHTTRGDERRRCGGDRDGQRLARDQRGAHAYAARTDTTRAARRGKVEGERLCGCLSCCSRSVRSATVSASIRERASPCGCSTCKGLVASPP